MSETDSIEAASQRLALALEALDAAAERRREAARSEGALATQIHALGDDRARLAGELDQAVARSRALETANREVGPAHRASDRDHPRRAGERGSKRGLKMSQVSVTINGRQFRMACEDGQEGHLMNLARDLDSRIEGLRAKFGEIGDTRLTVMAALTLADSLAETGLRIKRLEEDLAALQNARAEAVNLDKAAHAAIAAALNAAAERIESITKKLNQPVGGGSVALG